MIKIKTQNSPVRGNSNSESGQAIVAGLVCFLLALVVSALIGYWALRNFTTAREVAESQNNAFFLQMPWARHLNEISLQQSMATWHLYQVLIDRQELREALLLSASARKYNHTALQADLQKPSKGLGKLREALSNRSARSFGHLEASLIESNKIIQNAVQHFPELGRLVETVSVAALACSISIYWVGSDIVQFPVLTGIFKVLSLGKQIKAQGERSSNCRDTFSASQTGTSLTDSTVRLLQELFGSPGELQNQVKANAFSKLSFYRMKSGASVEQISKAFSKSYKKSFEVDATLDHPEAELASSLFDPRWIVKLTKVTR